MTAEEAAARATHEVFADDLVDPERVQADIDAAFPPHGLVEAAQEARAAANDAEIDRRVQGFRGLHAKITEVIMEVTYIQKTGEAPRAMGGYKFVEAGQIAAKIRVALASRGVTMLPERVRQVGEIEHIQVGTSGREMLIQTIKQTWRLTDAETGETCIIESMGTGGDMGDKFSPKAQTNAMKYALQVGFLLETGDDPEKADLSEPQQGPGVTIEPSAVSGVQQGGRQTKATSVQLDEVRRHAKRLDLTPETLTVIIAASLGGLSPELDEKDDTSDQQRTVIAFLNDLSFEDAGKVVSSLADVPDSD